MSTEWLEQLKEGDKVLVIRGRGQRSIDTVHRFTPTLLFLRNTERRFRRTDGREHGGGTWDAWQIAEATPQAAAKVLEDARRRVLATRLTDTAWRSLPLSVLEQVNAVLESHPNAEKEQS